MGLVATVASIVLVISFFTFVAFFGRLPALRHTPIAWLHRVLWVHIPNGVYALDRRLTSGRATTSLGRFGRYLMYDKHPTILIFFLLLLSVSEYMYLPTAWPLMGPLARLSAGVAIALPYLFLYLAAFSDPGTVTPASHAHHQAQYPYDFILFRPGHVCRTCALPKPARSKHCPICKRCVARLDHHCIFINNCVGAGNTHWFLLLLLSTGLLTLYAGALGVSLLSARIRTRYPTWRAWLPAANDGAGMPLRQWLIPWSWGLQAHVGMGSVTLLTVLTSPLVWGLLAYHLWLAYAGTTTNESLKWGDWKAEMDEGLVFKRRMEAGRQKDPRFEAGRSRWPVETEQIVVRTDDGRPPPDAWRCPGTGDWERVWELRDVENLYDLGLWDNLVDIFVPGYRFTDQRDVPLVETRGRVRRRQKLRHSRIG